MRMRVEGTMRRWLRRRICSLRLRAVRCFLIFLGTVFALFDLYSAVVTRMVSATRIGSHAAVRSSHVCRLLPWWILPSIGSAPRRRLRRCWMAADWGCGTMSDRDEEARVHLSPCDHGSGCGCESESGEATAMARRRLGCCWPSGADGGSDGTRRVEGKERGTTTNSSARRRWDEARRADTTQQRD